MDINFKVISYYNNISVNTVCKNAFYKYDEKFKFLQLFILDY